MAIVLAILGYGTFVYGYEVAGCIMLGLAIGGLWAEARLTNPRRDRDDELANSTNQQRRSP